jgi:hypothetical protein
MSRIDRRNWLESDIGYKSSGGMFDLFDNSIKSIYRINDDEFDHLCGVMTDEETQLFVTENPTFAEKRMMIELLNKHIKYE